MRWPRRTLGEARGLLLGADHDVRSVGLTEDAALYVERLEDAALKLFLVALTALNAESAQRGGAEDAALHFEPPLDAGGTARRRPCCTSSCRWTLKGRRGGGRVALRLMPWGRPWLSRAGVRPERGTRSGLRPRLGPAHQRQLPRSRKQEARGNKPQAQGRRKEARGKRQEARRRKQ